jgi:hypothetical protein
MNENTGAENNANNNRSLLIPVIIALAAANVIFFVDEGLYDFRWMKNRYAWIFYLGYAVCLFLGQLIVKYTVLRKHKQFSILGCFLGLAVGTGIAFMIYTVLKR